MSSPDFATVCLIVFLDKLSFFILGASETITIYPDAPKLITPSPSKTKQTCFPLGLEIK